jgi:nicotinate-nucleotide adenylyltransferase
MVGLFIGSFNPPTKAHINICNKLKNSFTKIILLPVNSNDKSLININHRINMLNIIKRKYHFLEVSKIMKKYAFVNYRIIDLFKKEYGDINIIMGSDLLDKLDSFDNYEYLLENYYFTIIPRDNELEKLIKEKYLKYQDKFKIINYHSNVSSTLVREKLKNNKNVNGLLDGDVLKYIISNHLY